MEKFETIEVHEPKDGVAEIRLNRPEKRNAINVQMIFELEAALGAFEVDQDCRVLVLGANGTTFSSGHDLQRDQGLDLEWERKRATSEGRYQVEDTLYRKQSLYLRNFPKPTIARVQGPAIAAGWMLVSMCDLIVASHEARFQNPVVRMATSGPQLLFEPWDIGMRKAKELLFTGGWLSAEEGRQLGFVNRVVGAEDLMDETETLAREVAAMPPWSLRLMKQSLNHTADSMGQRESWDYQFLIRNLGHASEERAEFLSERLEGRSPRSFIASRDEPFTNS